MEKQNDIILLDTSILIDYFRKTNKASSIFVKLTEQYPKFAISVLTRFEIYMDMPPQQLNFWESIFENLIILDISDEIALEAVSIQQKLKKQRKRLELPDLLIGATAIFYKLPIATLNEKHFQMIDKLTIV